MDPNETLRQLREAAETIEYDRGQNINSFYELLDLWSMLDQWMTNGGTPPLAWTEKREYADRW